jgi:hypothetical protein
MRARSRAISAENVIGSFELVAAQMMTASAP